MLLSSEKPYIDFVAAPFRKKIIDSPLAHRNLFSCLHIGIKKDEKLKPSFIINLRITKRTKSTVY